MKKLCLFSPTFKVEERKEPFLIVGLLAEIWPFPRNWKECSEFGAVRVHTGRGQP